MARGLGELRAGAEQGNDEWAFNLGVAEAHVLDAVEAAELADSAMRIRLMGQGIARFMAQGIAR